MRILCWILISIAIVANATNLMLLKEFDGRDLSGFVMSEKYDGIRAFWDGKTLKTRNGKTIFAPAWWLESLPKDIMLDGELWSKRGAFQTIANITLDSNPSDEWREIKFMIFDSPNFDNPHWNTQPLSKRLEPLKSYLDTLESHPNIIIIEQIKIPNNDAVFAFLEQITRAGGEGVVVRNPNAPYESGRSNHIFKLKKMKDSECEITAINPGKGKFEGIMGSVTCKDITTKETFKIGSGFDKQMRLNPPKIGAIITYKFQNLTNENKPRFPVFLRITPQDK